MLRRWTVQPLPLVLPVGRRWAPLGPVQTLSRLFGMLDSSKS